MKYIYILSILIAVLMGSIHYVFASEKQIIGEFESVVLITESSANDIIARIDTGADSSSIDINFARELGLEILPATKTILDTRGKEVRNTVVLQFVLGDYRIETIGTVSDRSLLTTKMNIGKKDLDNFVVDPNKQFLTRPDSAQAFLSHFSLSGIFMDPGVKKILLFPILGAIIIMLRLLIGVKTYGIFAPILLSFSLLEFDIVIGILFYIVLISVGMFVKMILRNFNIPTISEMVLVMSIMSVSVITLRPFFSVLFDFSLIRITFPIVIAAFLIENFFTIWEESTLKDASLLLSLTLLVSGLLGTFAIYLLSFSSMVLVVLLLVSFIMVIVVSHYTGLRLYEFFRFRFARQKH